MASPGTDHSPHDFVLNYTKCALTLLLLRLNMNDSIHMGDGDRMYDCMQLMYLYLKLQGVINMPMGAWKLWHK